MSKEFELQTSRKKERQKSRRKKKKVSERSDREENEKNRKNTHIPSSTRKQFHTTPNLFASKPNNNIYTIKIFTPWNFLPKKNKKNTVVSIVQE